MPLGAHKAAMMGVAGTAATGDVVLISSQSFTGQASVTFSSGIDSTYGEYIFKLYNINPDSDDVNFTFQVNATDSTSYNENITSTAWLMQDAEAGSAATMTYHTSFDQQNDAVAEQILANNVANDADQGIGGEMHFFGLGDTTYAKQWYARFHFSQAANYTESLWTAGYINEATAIDDIRFKASSGNFDGVIKLWGVK